jgi:cell division septation protein DedD
MIPPVTKSDPAPVQSASFAPSREVSAKEPPIFGEPIKGSIYLQLGAVDKGMANVMVNGLRRLGFPSIISAGPNDRIFRVLVGPLADSQTAQATSRALEAFGITHFAKRIEEPPAAAKPATHEPDASAGQTNP